MKDKTMKRIRICCYVAIGLCVAWGLLWFGNLILSAFGVSDYPLQWFDWTEHRAYKTTIFAVYSLSIAAMIVMCVKMVLNVLKGLNENTVFPKSNVKLLFWFVLVDFIYLLVFNNLRVLGSDQPTFMIQHNNFVIPFFLLFFAFMYKVAADAVEENNLTI